MRCHYHKDHEGNPLLIPGCLGTALYWHLPDKEALKHCTCQRRGQKETEHIIQEMRKEIRGLKKAVKELQTKLNAAGSDTGNL